MLDVSSENRSYGRIAALNPDGVRFLAGDRALLAAYAGLAAAVLDSAALLESARREAAAARTLLELAQALAEATSPLAVARQLAVAVPRVVDCDRVCVHLYDRSAEVARPSAFVGFPPDVERLLADVVISPADTPLLAEIIDHPEPLRLTDEHDDRLVREMVQLAGVCTVAVVPLVSSGRFYGILTAGVVDDEERLDLREELLARLRALAAQSSTGLRNAELVARIQHDALHDGLTGLPNRTALEDRTTHALHQAQRGGESVALLFVDIDDFKRVNDTYGHSEGDDVLRQVAARFTGAVRSMDTVARLGGDEFVVLVLDADAAVARAVAAKLLAAFERPFSLADGRAARVTCSIGIATASGATDVAALIGRADGAMYEAKAAGRNTSAVADR